MYTWSMEVSKSIHDGKWLAVVYENSEKTETKFWCCVKDINPSNKLLTVDIYNSTKTPSFVQNYSIYFMNIRSAYVLESSYYDTPVKLVEKIKNNPDEFDFLEYNTNIDKVLQYYLECYNEDSQPYNNEFTLVPGIDIDSFVNKGKLVLSEDIFEQAVKILRNQLNMKVRNNAIYEKIVLNRLSVFSNLKGIIPIVYHNVFLDIEKQSFIVSEEYEYSNRIIKVNDDQHYLENYLDVDYGYFKSNFTLNESEFIEQIKANLSMTEKIDEKPYFMKIVSRYSHSLRDEYNSIQEKFENQKLTHGLKSFFSLTTKQSGRPSKREIIVDSKKTNLNQLRTIYCAVNKNVTFVQGPPGTGKTVSIVNILHSSIFNKDTVLVATNNNEALNNITDKIDSLSYQGNTFFYPYLRLGSDEYIRQSLKRIEKMIEYYENNNRIDKVSELMAETRTQLKDNMSEISTLVDQYEEKQELIERREILFDMKKMLSKSERLDVSLKQGNIIDLEAQIEHYTAQIDRLNVDEMKVSSVLIDEQLTNKFLLYSSQYYGKILLSKATADLKDIIKIKSEKDRLNDFKKFMKTEDGMKVLMKCFPVIISTNVSVLKFGTPNSLFDLLIMEEASQCSTALALIPMNRSKRACFIGDPNQLQPVVNITEEKNELLKRVYKIQSSYDYLKKSVLNTLLEVDQISKFILLNKHYRCNKKIIGFSNKKYYNQQLEIKTDDNSEKPLKLLNIKNSVSTKKNTSHSEVKAILNEISNTDKNKEIAVITPFRNQAKLIQDELEKNGITNVKVGTIHSFQGQERDKIIISTAVTPTTTQGAFDWIKDNKELINVATTRPKEELVVLADVDRIDALSKNEMNDYFEFLTYLKLNGEMEVKYQKNDIFDSRVDGYKEYNTSSETDFLETIAHLKSTVQKFVFIEKSRVSDVLDLEPLKKTSKALFDYATKAHFDFLLFDHMKRPLLIIEICGDEHFNDEYVIANDKKKQKICDDYKIKLLFIRNEDVRRYNEVKRLIIETLRN